MSLLRHHSAEMMTSSGETPGREPRIEVLYIGGSGRSGSTLLDRLIGQVDGFCAVGELVHLWERGVVRNELCGCGSVFAECGFWQRIGSLAFGGWDALDPREVLSLERAVNRHRFIPLMLAGAATGSYGRKLTAYRQILGRLYSAIQRTTATQVIVDSSKSAPYAFILAKTPDVDLRLVHLVRDSRGVAHSWTKRVVRPEITQTKTYMPRYHPARAAVEWTVDNVLFDRLGARGIPYYFVRYERLVRQPREIVRGILEFADARVPSADLDFIGADHALLGATHSVAGNPMRFRSGPVPLRADEQWRERMRPSDRIVVSALTWPFLSRFGYKRSWR